MELAMRKTESGLYAATKAIGFQPGEHVSLELEEHDDGPEGSVEADASKHVHGSRSHRRARTSARP